MADANITTPQTATSGMKAAISELDATITTLSRFHENDRAATSALLSATTARAFLRDALEAETPTDDLDKLRAAVEFMDCLSQGGFSEISAIAKLALVALEHPDRDLHQEVALALRAIWGIAEKNDSCIYNQAKEVGCSHSDPSTYRRSSAKRTVEVSHV